MSICRALEIIIVSCSIFTFDTALIRLTCPSSAEVRLPRTIQCNCERFYSIYLQDHFRASYIAELDDKYETTQLLQNQERVALEWKL